MNSFTEHHPGSLFDRENTLIPYTFDPQLRELHPPALKAVL